MGLERHQRNNSVRDSLGLSPWTFNNLNIYNSTKDTLLNTQTHLRAPHTGTPKVGGETWWGEKEEKQRGVTDAALQLGAHGEAQPRQGRNPVVAGTPFSWEKQRNLMNIPERMGSMCCGWAQCPRQGQGTDEWPQMFYNWHSIQKNKAIDPGCSLTSQS